jgi:hypothetical protein
MIEAIAMMRSTADECECRARKLNGARAVNAELMDVAAKWHLLAGQAAVLCKRSKELNGGDVAKCAQCSEGCLD